MPDYCTCMRSHIEVGCGWSTLRSVRHGLQRASLEQLDAASSFAVVILYTWRNLRALRRGCAAAAVAALPWNRQLPTVGNLSNDLHFCCTAADPDIPAPHPPFATLLHSVAEALNGWTTDAGPCLISHVGSLVAARFVHLSSHVTALLQDSTKTLVYEVLAVDVPTRRCTEQTGPSSASTSTPPWQ